MEEKNEIRLDVEPVSADGEAAECVGLHLGRTEHVPLAAAKKVWKKGIIENFRKQGKRQVKGVPFITITMPCGESISYDRFEDIPDEDVPCSCGKPNHWFVRHVLNVKISQN